MKIDKYVKPATLDEAYDYLSEKNGTAIGGGAWLRLLSKKVDYAVDLSGLELNRVYEMEEGLCIEAMTTLRELEVNDLVNKCGGGIIADAASKVMGVPFRNIATVGGSVMGRFGFSDIITPLLALNAKLVFYKGETISLSEFLETKGKGVKLLQGIIIPKEAMNGNRTVFRTVKKTAIDFPVLNVAVAKVADQVNIAVGSRPGAAVLATKASKALAKGDMSYEEVAKLVAEEVTFGDNNNGSKAYRKELATVLVKRGLKEVCHED